MNSTVKEDPLINFFITEEIRKYITPKENRVGKMNLYGTDKVYNTIGHACVLYKKELEKYMDYDIGSYCDDDWNLAQKLMLNGCDPLPRRRCLTRASKEYQRPYSINESLWRLPDGRNVRWGNYQCRKFECLSSKNPKRGYSKCIGCFEMEKEKLKWVANSSVLVDFFISEVLAIKPGEVRIGLDYGIGTGTFAARMREQNVTIVSTALNLGGLLWIDRFFCNRQDLDNYMYMFLQLRYKKHKWVLSPKSKDEIYLSAVLEKPPRAI
ncbi:hypothetical protein V8G54_017155 [Vigna mungo]|uniref:Methyltransferase n=1 Tax=Vigna mungo TaxID=3915 RepID=A0AAQ3NPB4_VIGMU